MNDKSERRGLIKLFEWLTNHANKNCRWEFKEVFEQAYYYCLTGRIVHIMFVQHLCVTPVRLCRTRGPWTQTHIVNPLRPDNHDNKTCIPRQLFVLKFNIKNYFESD